MNILTIEKARTELQNILENSSSRRLKLKRIAEFFSFLFGLDSTNLIESYLIEFIPQYLNYLKRYSAFGVRPTFTQNILDVNEKLLSLNELEEFKERLIHLNERVKDKQQSLLEILNGREISQTKAKVLFPVIEEFEGGDADIVLGAVDSLTIKISRTKKKDKFIVVPSESEKDKKLEKQINTSWLRAKEYCKKYLRKMSDYHEVIISFDEHLGIYRGESVGTAITIGFIEELLKYYNSQTILKPIGGVVFTGGILENGELNPVSEEIIKKKVQIAFYSNCSTLVVPKDDETFALHKLEEIRNEFPHRSLRIVGVKDLNEILFRRDLVEINKQKLVVRASKFVVKNWAGVVFAVVLTVLLTYIFALDFDDNPAIVEADSQSLYVKNRNGKILWIKNVTMPKEASSNSNILYGATRIVDINNDGKNEVLYRGGEYTTIPNINTRPGITCTHHKGEILWKYSFSDSVVSEREILDSFYSVSGIVDTITFNNEKSLFLSVSNMNSFSSAIFRVDLKTGRRLPGTMWCSGFVIDAIIKDLDNDGDKEMLAVGVDNGFEEIVILHMNLTL